MVQCRPWTVDNLPPLPAGNTYDSGNLGAASRSANATGLSPNLYYLARVIAYNAAGRGGTGLAYFTTTNPGPDAPTVAASAATNTVTATWTPATTGEAATSWQVRIGSGSWVTASGAALARSHTFTGLSSSTAYTVQVRGVNAAGNGAAGSASVTTLTAVPAAPTVTATAAVNSITATWTPATTGGDAATSWQARIGSGAWVTVTGGATARSHTFSSLSSDTSYTVEVRGVNAGGNGTAGSVTIRTLQNAPAAPAVALTSTTTTISATWTPGTGDAASSWEVRIGSGAWTTVSGGAAARSYDFTGLTSDTTYTVSVRGSNTGGTGAAGSATISTKAAVPAPPTVRTARAARSITVSWSPALTGGAATSWQVRQGTGAWTDGCRRRGGAHLHLLVAHPRHVLHLRRAGRECGRERAADIREREHHRGARRPDAQRRRHHQQRHAHLDAREHRRRGYGVGGPAGDGGMDAGVRRGRSALLHVQEPVFVYRLRLLGAWA